MCAIVDGRIERWTVSDICVGVAQPTYARLRMALAQWLDANVDLFGTATHVVLETQMRKKFIALNHMIAGYCAAFDVRVTVLSPKTLCSEFDFPRTRDEKKRATIQWAAERFPAEWDAVRHSTEKVDDLADACAMAWYAMVHH